MGKVRAWIFNHLPSKVQTWLLIQAIKAGQVKTVTFDKGSKQLVWQMIVRSNVKDLHCPFCGRIVGTKNFEGALTYKGKKRVHDGCWDALMYHLRATSNN